MLSIAKIPHGGERYYFASLAAEERHAGLREAPGIYRGAGAAELGLGGTVELAEFSRLLAGEHPTDRAVKLSASHQRVEIAAFDCTFSAPKAVSVLERLAPRDLASPTQRAHERAVASALSYLEREAAIVRRQIEGERVAVPANGVIAAVFVHHISRAPDPHLHSHVVIANLARGPEGRYSALDARRLFCELATAGSLYEAELRFSLSTELGVRWRRAERGGIDLVGITATTRAAFSRRSAAIAEDLKQGGWSSPKAAALAALRTRPPKDRETPLEDLERPWRAQGARSGLATSRWRRVAPQRPVAPKLDGAITLASIDGAFSRSDLLAAIARQAIGGAPVALLEAEVDRLLALKEIRHIGPGALSLRGPGRRLPVGVVVPRYRRQGAIEDERRLRELLQPAPGIIEDRRGLAGCGLIVLEMASLKGEERLCELMATTRRSGVAVHAWGADEAARAWLERQGVAAPALVAPMASLRSVTLLVAADRARLSLLAALAEQARAKGADVALIIDATPGRAPGSQRAVLRQVAQHLEAGLGRSDLGTEGLGRRRGEPFGPQRTVRRIERLEQREGWELGR